MTRVVDGDSLEVAPLRWFNFLLKPKPFQVRLYAIDAPELSQPYGAESKERMRRFVRGSMRLDVVNTDRYGRVVGVLYHRKRRDSLNHKIVGAGLAYSYQRYGRLDGIDDAEAYAKKRRLGVWKSGGSQTRPWDHRRATRAKSGRKRRWRPLRLAFILAVLAALFFSLQWMWSFVDETLRAIIGG